MFHYSLTIKYTSSCPRFPYINTLINYVSYNFISFFNESPRWLMSKGRTSQAYRLLFEKPVLTHNKNTLESHQQIYHEKQAKSTGVFYEICSIYRTEKLRRTAIICHFGFFTVSFSYIVTGQYC